MTLDRDPPSAPPTSSRRHAWLLVTLLAGCARGPTDVHCDQANDCPAGICAAVAPSGRVCAARCDDGSCDEGFQCVATDAVALCVRDDVMNCQPCQVDGDCNQAGLFGYACISYGSDGSFCASPCGQTRPCSKGYACADGRCRLGAGLCTCNDIGLALGAETTCAHVGDAGTCPGMRGCGASGLSPCIGASPGPEVCDLHDNDCDGTTDEGLVCGTRASQRAAVPVISRTGASVGTSVRLVP